MFKEGSRIWHQPQGALWKHKAPESGPTWISKTERTPTTAIASTETPREMGAHARFGTLTTPATSRWVYISQTPVTYTMFFLAAVGYVCVSFEVRGAGACTSIIGIFRGPLFRGSLISITDTGITLGRSQAPGYQHQPGVGLSAAELSPLRYHIVSYYNILYNITVYHIIS